MSVPNHENCTTRSWPASCPDCGEAVFFFSCSCGSKVYFDELQPPWPLHADSCLALLARNLFNENRSAEDIRRLIEQEAAGRGAAVPAAAYRVLNELDGGRRSRGIARQVPVAETDAEGTIFGLVPAVNIFRRFGLPDNVISRQILGEHATETYAEVTLREDRDPLTGVVAEFTFLVPARMLTAARARQGSRVYVALQPFAFQGSETTVWMATEVAAA